VSGAIHINTGGGIGYAVKRRRRCPTCAKVRAFAEIQLMAAAAETESLLRCGWLPEGWRRRG